MRLVNCCAVIEEQAVGADLAYRATQMLARAQIARADGRFEEALELATNGFDVASEIGNRDAVVTDSFVEAVEAAFALEDLATVDELLGRVDELRPGERSPFLDSQIARFHARLAAIRRRGAPKPASSSPPRRSASAMSASTSRRRSWSTGSGSSAGNASTTPNRCCARPERSSSSCRPHRGSSGSRRARAIGSLRLRSDPPRSSDRR